jgi:RimJ/RimL family protein N-acetyltransferase
MTDKPQQGKGYGVRSLELCFEEFKKEFPPIGCVELIHYPDNDRAAAVYEKAGFKLTGGRVKSAPGRIERGSTDVNRTYEVTRRRYY